MVKQLQSKRILNDRFFNDLKNGILSPILKAVREDNNLILEIRQNYINIYYRGGNILELRQANNFYKAKFDPKYCKNEKHQFEMIVEIKTISNAEHSLHWANNFHVLKQLIDYYNTLVIKKLEKEFQQLVVQENNIMRAANDTDYYIVDFEYTSSVMKDARFDLVGLKWDSTSNDRKNPDNCKLAIIEMKYGDDALKDKSGIISHIKKAESFFRQEKYLENFKTEMLGIFQQKRDLGLMRFGRNNNSNKVTSISGRPEFILLLAGHKPIKSQLRSIIKGLQPMRYADLKIATASFMGYALYKENILNLDDFKKLL